MQSCISALFRAQLRGTPVTTIAFTYDNLDRVTVKNLPGAEPDVTYAYDNLGRLTSASQTGNDLSFTYDALSRNLTQVGPQGPATSEWDIAGRRTKLIYPGSGLFVDYDYLVTGETTKIRENGATFGVGVLATYAYDDLGRRTSLTFGNGVVQAIAFDPISRLASLTNDLTGTGNDLSQTLSYNPASQISSAVRTGDAYAWTGHFDQNVTGTANGLNQLTSVGAKTLTHDARGNVTAFGTKAFTYSSENLLATGPNATTLGYDPLARLQQIVSGGVTTKLAYDGLDRIAEYDGSNALLRRTIHGPNIDEPLVWYEGSSTADRRFLSSDERGSIISVTDSAGALFGINRYDEYGMPQATNLGAFGYTGQAWLPTIGVWYYKARDYDPELGRFLQTDPIGMAGGINLYAYVGNDPVNSTDPLGLCEDKAVHAIPGGPEVGTIVVTALCPSHDFGPGSGAFGGRGSGSGVGDPGDRAREMQRRRRGAKQERCGLQAVANNFGSLALNAAGAAIPGATAATTLAKLGISGIGLIYGAATSRNGCQAVAGMTLGIADFHVTSAGPWAGQSAGAVAKNLPFIGNLISGAAVGMDIKNIVDDFRKCMSGS